MPTAPRRKRATKVAKKIPEPIRYDTTAPEPAQAAQIALIVMKRAKCGDWSRVIELARQEEIRDKVWLSPEQQDLLDRHARILPYLRVSPLVTVIACPVCGRYGLQDKRPASGPCYFTLRCAGKLVKASSVEPRRRQAIADVGGTPHTQSSPSPSLGQPDDGVFG